MNTLTIRAQVNKRGLLTLEMPSELADREIDLVIVYEQVDEPTRDRVQTAVEQWPTGFYAATAGAWQGEPLTREDQGVYEVRDSLP